MFSPSFMNAYLTTTRRVPQGSQLRYEPGHWGSNLGSSPNRKASTWPACRNPLRGFLFLLWWRGCSSLLRQQRECGGIFYRDVGENFAVKIHAGSFQSMNQLPVRDPVQ